MINKTITLNHTGFVITGEVTAELFNGEEISVKILPSIIKDPDFEINETSVRSFIKVTSIEIKGVKSAIVRVDLDYEGYKIFYDEFVIYF